ncbi:MAG: MBL fold metallo-hydrolase [Calditrichaeota bacterium]|nr:MAG: MBL fold metallo-hydrolase [Calditrichota bacterium]
MILETYYLDCLAQASYLIISEGEALVIDPQRDIKIYLEAAKKHNAKIKYVFETHHHADFVSGHLEFAKVHDATIFMGKEAKADFNFVGVADGSVLRFGKAKVEFRETPGHTLESVCAVLFDLEKDAKNPEAVFTGDTLFIGDVGRPDLLGATISKEELATMLYNSLQTKLLVLPNETKVYPGHGAGSMCGKALSNDKVSTIGREKDTNYALQAKSKEEFISLVATNQPIAPKYFPLDVQINRKGAQPLQNVIGNLRPFSTQEVVLLQNRGAKILDVRSHKDFSQNAIPSSINVGLDGSFATWAGCVFGENDKVIIVAQEGKEAEVATRLSRIGLDIAVGYLAGGIESWEGEMEPKPRLAPKDLESILENPNFQFVDIRGVGEFQTERIENFKNFPLNNLSDSVANLSKDKEIILMCRSSYRSSVARTFLENLGFKKVTDVEGGILACQEDGLKIVTEECSMSKV